MTKSLIKAHELIQNIQANLKNSKKLKDHCSQLEDLIEYIATQSQYHYRLLLVEIYASKLRDFYTAQKICKLVIKDARPSVELQGTLRLSFINALQQKYPQAIKILQQADQQSKKKQQLQLIVINYCQRLFNYSSQSNLLKGHKLQRQLKYKQAIKYYEAEFDNQTVQNQIQNKQFAAKTILQMLKSYPANTFSGINPTKYQNYQQQLYQQRQQRNDQNLAQKLHQNYINKKNYIKKIVELLQTKQKNLVKLTKSTNNNLNTEFDQKRLLGVWKIMTVLKYQKDLNQTIRNQLTNCLKQFTDSLAINYNMLSQFIERENKIINRGKQLIRKSILKPCFQKLKNYSEGIQPIQPVKQKLPKKNRFINEPKNQLPVIEQNVFHIRPVISQTISQVDDIANFTGSYMQKINQTSQGSDKRYFYFKKNQLKQGKIKLYYNKKQSQISSSDDYYELKKYKNIVFGKQTKPLQRSECKKFQQNKCFAILYNGDKSKNFYVEDKKIYDKWVLIFKKFQRDQKMQKGQKTNYISKSPNPKQLELTKSITKINKDKSIQKYRESQIQRQIFQGTASKMKKTKFY